MCDKSRKNRGHVIECRDLHLYLRWCGYERNARYIGSTGEASCTTASKDQRVVPTTVSTRGWCPLLFPPPETSCFRLQETRRPEDGVHHTLYTPPKIKGWCPLMFPPPRIQGMVPTTVSASERTEDGVHHYFRLRGPEDGAHYCFHLQRPRVVRIHHYNFHLLRDQRMAISTRGWYLLPEDGTYYHFRLLETRGWCRRKPTHLQSAVDIGVGDACGGIAHWRGSFRRAYEQLEMPISSIRGSVEDWLFISGENRRASHTITRLQKPKCQC